VKNTNPHPHALKSTLRHRSPPATINLTITVTPESNRICPVDIPSIDVILIPCQGGKSQKSPHRLYLEVSEFRQLALISNTYFYVAQQVLILKLTQVSKMCRMVSTYTPQICSKSFMTWSAFSEHIKTSYKPACKSKRQGDQISIQVQVSSIIHHQNSFL